MLTQPLWFYGRVENIHDDLESGKVQVRVHGVHSPSPEQLPTKYLPWAQVMLPAIGSSQTTGRSPTGLEIGTEVCGISLDESYTDLKVMFTWHGVDEDFNDVNPIARGENNPIIDTKQEAQHSTEGGGTTWTEPMTDYTKVTYPDNDVDVTRGGHILEVDNTKGQERIHVYHKSGTYYEMQQTGDMVTRVSKDHYSIVGQTVNEWIGNNARRIIEGSRTERVKGSEYNTYGGGRQLIGKGGVLWNESDLFELVVPLMRIVGELHVSEVIRTPTIHVGTIYANTAHIQTAKINDGTSTKHSIASLNAHAPTAGWAATSAGKGFSSPAKGNSANASSPSVPTIKQTISDKDGGDTNE